MLVHGSMREIAKIMEQREMATKSFRVSWLGAFAVEEKDSLIHPPSI